MKLFYAPTACSLAPHIALEEVGLPFETQRIDLAANQQGSEEYRRINPMGRVPALAVDDRIVTEVPALLTYIASLNPAARLVPEPGTLDYARCFEWLGFLSSTVHVLYAQFRRPTRFSPEGSPHLDQLSLDGRANTIAAYREVERRLADAWAAGSGYSIADIYLVPFHGWAWRFDMDIERECPKWSAIVAQVMERPAAQRALAREQAPV